MNINEKSLKSDEKAIFSLRSLYSKYGYSQYKMSKFEEYDLYVRNKDFLVSDNIITFNDLNGRLMALKPDVTLSIIKSCKDIPGEVEKLYYNENVYRVSKGTQSFKEIMQVGLECIGDIDAYCVFEVILLAAKSLMSISEECVLDISHLGLLSEVIEEAGLTGAAVREVIRLVGEKNTHEIRKLCQEENIDDEKTGLLLDIVTTYGDPKKAIEKLRGLLSGSTAEAHLDELSAIIDAAEEAGVYDILRIDFSVVNDVKYYNGIAFKGFINGAPYGILSGGRYDNLLSRMGRKAGAIGFAVYLDALQSISQPKDSYDIDTLLLYDEGEDIKTVRKVADMLSENGASVLSARKAPEKLRYKRLIRVNNGEVTILEQNA